jgi:prephenate dehydrogenase
VSSSRRANVIGLGLIGGSVGMALRRAGWVVSGNDVDESRGAQAMSIEAVDELGLDPTASLSVVAVPVSQTTAAVRAVLAAAPHSLVTDVGSVKAPVARQVTDGRFVAGHPMAGSERLGLDGADPDMFQGAVWVLTPTETTPDRTFTTVAAVARELGAEVVALSPERHDSLVAVVSHVPHLTAATLVRMADARAEDHAALLRLAAGGFRDMTRIASGHPAIWPDICSENRVAIVDALDEFIVGLAEMRELVRGQDRVGLTLRLEQARLARNNLPVRGARPEDLAEVRIPIPDRPGAAAEIFTLAAELGVNIESFEVVHSVEGSAGVALLLVEATRSELYRGGLIARGYRPTIERLQ